jgi:hypothetical protein
MRVMDYTEVGKLDQVTVVGQHVIARFRVESLP